MDWTAVPLSESINSRGVLGGLAAAGLLVDIPWPRLLSRTAGPISALSVPYIDDLIPTVGSLLTNTFAGPVAGLTVTFLLVLGVMFEAFTHLRIRNTAALYTTVGFRLLLVFVAGGFGVGSMLLFGLLDSYVPAVPDGTSYALFGAWALIGTTLLTGYLSYEADPTRPENPVVAFLSRISGSDAATYRRTQVTESWAPTRVAAAVATFTVGFMFVFVTILLGFLTAIATLLYPLPELLVLLWILAQLSGLHRLPYLGWLENIEVEERVYEKLGTGTTTFYGIAVSLAYIVSLGVSALLTAGGVGETIQVVGSVTELLATAGFASVFAMPGLAVWVLSVSMAAMAVVLAGVHYVAYWVLALLRLPAVADENLPASETRDGPSYRRLEGFTVPGAVAFVSAAVYFEIDPGLEAVVLQSAFLVIFVLGTLLVVWAFSRALGSDHEPQQVRYEETAVRIAVIFQASALAVGLHVREILSLFSAAVLTILWVGLVVGAQYLGKKIYKTPAVGGMSGRLRTVLIVTCLTLTIIVLREVPSFSPVVPVLLMICVGVLILSSVFNGRED